MNIVLLGVNHKTAPVALRERIAIAPAQLAEATRSLVQSDGVREGMILSTCNRVELMALQDSAAPRLLEFVASYFQIDAGLLRPHLYEYREREAILHLFRVAASLDSMVVGEPQILGQVKESYLAARSVGAVRSQMDRLMQRALTVAKKVRSETQIGSASVSIASVAVELGQKIFGSLEAKKVLVVGAGKMSTLAARRLADQGVSALWVANRSQERAEEMARKFGGSAIPFENLYSTAAQADIVITSTGAPQAIFGVEQAQQFMQRRRSRPMVFIDIAVPRDVDPEINRLDGIFLYDIDDLESLASSHLAERRREAELAEALVAAEADRFQRGLQTLNVVPEIVQIQESVERIRQRELGRMQGRLQALSAEQRAAVDSLTRSLAAKFLHHPMQAIKAAAGEGNAAAVEAIRQAFGLGLAGSCPELEEGAGKSCVEAVEAAEAGIPVAVPDEEL